MNRKERIIAIIPALNEEDKIGIVVSRILKEAAWWIDKVIVVDDGSQDKTGQEARETGAYVIRHARKMGVGAAIRTGIDYALREKYDIAVVLGGDDQDNPDEISHLLAPILNDHFDFVQGSRYLAGGAVENITPFRWVGTKIYSRILKVILGFSISDGTNGFRAFRLGIFKDKHVNIWQDWLNHYELEPYLFYKVIENRFQVTEAPVTKRYPRNHKNFTKMVPFLDWWSILRPLILLKSGIKK